MEYLKKYKRKTPKKMPDYDTINMGGNMNSKLYNLFMAYHDKELDDSFINEAFDIITRHDSVREYINDFHITEEESVNLGTYSIEERIIEFNKQSVLNDKTIKNKKLLALQVILHELEHARNLQRIYLKRDDIETKVVRYSLLEYAIKHNLYYRQPLDKLDILNAIIYKDKLYDICPGERIAEIKTWKYLVNLLKNQRRSSDLLTARGMLYFAYIRGYQTNKYYLEPPTYEYLLTLGLYHEHYHLKNQFNNNNYNLDTRLLCGLPISEKEYRETTLMKVKLKFKDQTTKTRN